MCRAINPTLYFTPMLGTMAHRCYRGVLSSLEIQSSRPWAHQLPVSGKSILSGKRTGAGCHQNWLILGCLQFSDPFYLQGRSEEDVKAHSALGWTIHNSHGEKQVGGSPPSRQTHSPFADGKPERRDHGREEESWKHSGLILSLTINSMHIRGSLYILVFHSFKNPGTTVL